MNTGGIVKRLFATMKTHPLTLLVAVVVGPAAAVNSINARGDTIYMPDDDTPTIYKYTSGGVRSVFETGQSVFCLACDGTGNIYALNNSKQILKFDANGSSSLFANLSPYIPEFLTFNSAGTLYASLQTGDYSKDVIEKFTSGGVGSVFAHASGPSSLAFDSAGNLYAICAFGSIEKFAPNGVSSVFASGYGGLAFDSAGNLFTTNGGYEIVKYTPSGVGSLFADTGNYQPTGLAFDSGGNLYAAMSNYSTIEKFTPGGVGSYFASLHTGEIAVQMGPYWTGGHGTNWADAGNWSGPVPGAISGTMSTDAATFNQNAPNSPLTIDAGRNLQNITFDTAKVNSLRVGTTGGNALLLTAGGTIQTTSTVINPQTVNAPLVPEGDYTFTSGATSSSATLNFGGGITPGATTGVTTLALNGANTGVNTISGVLADNGSGQLAVTKSGPGLWILSGANTNSGDIAVTGGALRFNVTSGTPTIAAGVTATVASGATLELAGSISALGTAGGNRAHVINSSTAPGVLVSGTHQVVGGIDGTGSVQVNAGSDLTADHIIQNALIIGGAAGSPSLVTIAASDSSGNPLGEPSTLALAGLRTPSNSFGDGVNSVNLLDGPAITDSSSGAGSPSGSPGGVGSSTVPEPSTMLLFILAMAGLAASRLLRSLPYRFTAIANLNQSRFF